LQLKGKKTFQGVAKKRQQVVVETKRKGRNEGKRHELKVQTIITI